MKKKSTHEEDNGRNELNSHRNSPSRRFMHVHGMVDSVIDPEPYQGAELIGNLEKTNKNTSDGRDRDLCDIRWYSPRNPAASNASKRSPSIYNQTLA